MSDTSYTVDAQLRLQGGGNFNSGMQAAAAKAMELERALGNVRGGLAQTGRGLWDIGESVVTVAAKAATGVIVGIAGSAALLAHAAFGEMSELEGKGIQLASVLAASTGAPFEAMRVKAGGLFEQFREDAIKSAGETSDFVNVASKIAGPLVGAGKSMEDLHTITAGVMAAAPSLGIAFDQAGSDVMRMLQGVAGVEQPLFRAMVAIPSLGIATAEKFNKLPVAERYEKIAQALSNPAFGAAASAYGSSWAGLASTLSDVGKQAKGALAGAIFDGAKMKLAAFNDAAMDALGPNGKLGNALSNIGTSIAFRFDAMDNQLTRIFPSLDAGATGFVNLLGSAVDAGLGGIVHGMTWVADHWDPIVDGAHRFAAAFENAAQRAEQLITSLGGGDFANGLIRLTELFAAKKAADAAAPVLGGVVQTGSGLAGIAKMLFSSEGAAAGAATAAAAPVVAGAAPAATVGAAEAGAGAAAAAGGAGLLTTALAALAGAIALVAIPVTVAAGAVYFLSDGFTTVGAAATAAWSRVDTAFGGVWTALGGLGTALGNLLGPTGAAGDAINSVLTAAIGEMASSAVRAAASMQVLIQGITAVANAASSALVWMGVKGLGGSPLEGEVAGSARAAADAAVMTPNMSVMSTGTSGTTAAMVPGRVSPRGGGGGGGKQEIVIKWDLGDGNEEAIFIKSRGDIARSLRSATSVSRGSPLRGTT